MPSHWDEASRSAWRKFGRRHMGWFVYPHLAAKVAPVVLGAAALVGVVLGLHWVWQHVPVRAVGLLCALAAVLVGGTWGAWEFFTLTAARKGATVARLSAAGATLAFGFAAFYTLALR